MRILIIDDHQLFIDGIRHIVKLLDDDVDILEANSAGDAIQYMESNSNLDLVLLDLHMPGLDGTSIIQYQQSKASCFPIVIISGDDDPQTIQSVIESGVMGFIPKSYSGKKLLNALRTILDGEIYIPKTNNMLDSDHYYNNSYNNDANDVGITKRQLQVLELLASGHSNKKVSSILFLTENTVKAHVSALFRALDASNRTECVKIARNKGIIR